MKTKVFRINLATYKKLRQKFPGFRGETVAQYFKRLEEHLQ